MSHSKFPILELGDSINELRPINREKFKYLIYMFWKEANYESEQLTTLMGISDKDFYNKLKLLRDRLEEKIQLYELIFNNLYELKIKNYEESIIFGN